MAVQQFIQFQKDGRLFQKKLHTQVNIAGDIFQPELNQKKIH
jgi:hypothetical protein